MISLSPLLKPALQVEIGQSSQARNISARPRRSGHDRHSRTRYWLPEFPPYRSFVPATRAIVAIIGGFRRDRRKIVCQIARRMGIERRDRAPHVLLRKWIVSRVLAKTPDLAHDVLRPLSGEPRRDRIALRPGSVTPGAVADGGALTGPAHDGRRREPRIARIAIFNPMRFMTPSFRASCTHRHVGV